MTTATQRFIEKMVEGKAFPFEVIEVECYEFEGIQMVKLWQEKTDHDRGRYVSLPVAHILLNPENWQAVGKVEGWEENHFPTSEHRLGDEGCNEYCAPKWKNQQHRMIDALASGKSIEEYLGTIV